MESQKIIHGDAFGALSKVADSVASLFYVDPPFLTQRDFLFETRNRVRSAFDDRWTGGIEEYCDWIEPIFREAHRILRADGSLYLHVDTRLSHYLKVMLDKVFGPSNFRNEVIWQRLGSHNDSYQGARFYGRIHDVILFYTKSSKYVWNQVFLPYDPHYVREKYRYLEEGTGRRYALGDLSGPGGPAKGNPKYEFLGHLRYWRYSKEKMTGLLHEGLIVQLKPGGVPLIKRYLDEMSGKPVQDIWDDIRLARGKQSVGYPTQKPLRLLERIILASSDPGDLCIDPLCGSGSTLLAAHLGSRRWLGIDRSEYACNLASRRLKKAGAQAPIVKQEEMAKSAPQIRAKSN